MSTNKTPEQLAQIPFEQWREELIAVFKKYWPEHEPDIDESWRDYYDNDYTPEEAFREDASYE